MSKILLHSLVFLTFLPCLAQEQTEAQKESARRAELHQKGMQKLAFLQGPWHGVRLVTNKEGVVEEKKIQFEFKKTLGDKFLEAEMQSNGFTFRLILSFDQVQNLYRMVSMDNISGLADIYQGHFKEGVLELENISGNTYYEYKGLRMYNRMRFHPVSEGEWTFVVETSKDKGAWEKPISWKITR